MFFWRISLTCIGMTCGAILGLLIVAISQWLDGIFIILLVGSLLGAVCGWVISPIVPKTVERLKEWLPPDNPRIPPPREVVRLGWALGSAEGAVVGASYGGIVAAVIGGYVGMIWGPGIAELSWRVRRRVSLLLLALFLGFLIEVGGCLVIAVFIKTLADSPSVMYLLCTQLVLLFLLRLGRQLRGYRPTPQHENFDSYET
jgi:hypothetical protein